jgi:serine/threonine protein kinase
MQDINQRAGWVSGSGMATRKSKPKRITRISLESGEKLLDHYEVVQRLGGGWEGEVYLIRELKTGIERTAKFFFPHRNPKDRAVQFYAKKLHKLRHCPIVIQYYSQDHIIYEGTKVAFLVSEYVEGELLTDFLKRQRGKRLLPFQAIHLLHALATGIECIHQSGDYHGDLHTDNIIVQRFGLGFDLKLLDMFQWGPVSGENIREDVINMIHIFYEALGGKQHYASQPPAVKEIICGLKRSLILKKFRRAGQLRNYLETMTWD